MLKRSKKGFTLAELLIVVAIIAVLTAIAVPLFVSSLDNAKEETYKANEAAVKQAAIVAIISAKEGEALHPDTLFANENKVYASAVVDEKGNMSDLQIKWEKKENSKIKATTKYSEWKNADSASGKAANEIVVLLDRLDINSATAEEVITSPGG